MSVPKNLFEKQFLYVVLIHLLANSKVVKKPFLVEGINKLLPLELL